MQIYFFRLMSWPYLPPDFDAEMKLIPNCGHLPMFEHEAAFVETIVGFCKR